MRAGLKVDADLTAAIIAEIYNEPGTLPLLQYALTEVFERREGNTLTLGAYQESGGALGALARRAQEIYEAMDDIHLRGRGVRENVSLRIAKCCESSRRIITPSFLRD